MLNENINFNHESTSILEIPTVLEPPLSSKLIEGFIICPICEFDIELNDKLTFIDNNDFAFCEDCNHKIIFKIKKI